MKKTLGQNLKLYRQISKFNQLDFATALDTTQQRVSEWECDLVLPSLIYVNRILLTLNISYEELTEDIF